MLETLRGKTAEAPGLPPHLWDWTFDHLPRGSEFWIPLAMLAAGGISKSIIGGRGSWRKEEHWSFGFDLMLGLIASELLYLTGSPLANPAIDSDLAGNYLTLTFLGFLLVVFLHYETGGWRASICRVGLLGDRRERSVSD